MPAMSRSDRIAKVEQALAELPAAIATAIEAEYSAATAIDKEYSPAKAESLWERVETLGAVVHRQSRILAGKSRGG